MRPNLLFLLAASNAILKPGGLLRWKKRLVKDPKLSLLLTKVMKIARLASPLLDAPRQSSPRPRRRHGRRLALLFHLNLTLNLYTLFFALSLAYLPRLLPFLTSPTAALEESDWRWCTDGRIKNLCNFLYKLELVSCHKNDNLIMFTEYQQACSEIMYNNLSWFMIKLKSRKLNSSWYFIFLSSSTYFSKIAAAIKTKFA